MGNTEQSKIIGLTDTGHVKPNATDSDIEEIRNQLLNLSVKSDLSARIAAIELGCREHSDSLTSQAAVHIVGCSIFSEAVSSILPLVGDDLQPESPIIKFVANVCNDEYQMVKKHTERMVGFSDPAKKRFLSELKEFLYGSIAKNIQGFTVGVANLIR